MTLCRGGGVLVFIGTVEELMAGDNKGHDIRAKILTRRLSAKSSIWPLLCMTSTRHIRPHKGYIHSHEASPHTREKTASFGNVNCILLYVSFAERALFKNENTMPIMYIYAYIYKYTYTYICICIYICTYIYTHVYISFLLLVGGRGLRIREMK